MDKAQDLIETDLLIDSDINLHLKETAAWGKFLAVIGFVYSCLIAVGAIFAASMFSRLSTAYGSGASAGLLAGGSVAIIYLAIAAVVFFMSMHLFRFAKKTQLALQGNDQLILSEAFRNLKIYFRFTGIITLIALVFSVLGVIGIIAAAAFSKGG
ncbi:MAG: hypothetical protein JWP81_2375 [Ferruginibacter sp.]|nr:hypothetical protein [Ferruginibacter sp.]